MGERELPDVGCPLGDLGAEVGGLLGERNRVRVEVDVHESAELLDAHLVEADVGDVEVHEVGGAAGRDQLPIEAVRPGVVRTDDRARSAPAGEQLMGAMLAHVVEGPQLARLVTNRDDRACRPPRLRRSGPVRGVARHG